MTDDETTKLAYEFLKKNGVALIKIDPEAWKEGLEA